MSNLKVVSLNVRGLNNRLKRKRLFRELHVGRYDIIMLQECYSCPETECIWSSEWGGKTVFAHGDKKAHGVCILFSNRCNGIISNVTTSNDGRYIIVDICIENKMYTVVNVYAPNNDSPEFFHNLINTLETRSWENIIWGGDFNLVMDTNNDSRCNRVQNNRKAHKMLCTYMSTTGIRDIWRLRNPDTNRFTCFQRHKGTASRIDLFLVNDGLIDRIEKCSIHSASRYSDHNMLELIVNTSATQRGPGIWRLNVRLLQDDSFVEELKREVQWQTNNTLHMNPHDKWEHIKSCIQSMCQKQGKKVSTKIKVDLDHLLHAVEILDKECCEVSDYNVKLAHKDLKVINNRIREIQDVKAQGNIFRSRAKWHQEGEKSF